MNSLLLSPVGASGQGQLRLGGHINCWYSNRRPRQSRSQSSRVFGQWVPNTQRPVRSQSPGFGLIVRIGY